MILCHSCSFLEGRIVNNIFLRFSPYMFLSTAQINKAQMKKTLFFCKQQNVEKNRRYHNAINFIRASTDERRNCIVLRY